MKIKHILAISIIASGVLASLAARDGWRNGHGGGRFYGNGGNSGLGGNKMLIIENFGANNLGNNVIENNAPIHEVKIDGQTWPLQCDAMGYCKVVMPKNNVIWFSDWGSHRLNGDQHINLNLIT